MRLPTFLILPLSLSGIGVFAASLHRERGHSLLNAREDSPSSESEITEGVSEKQHPGSSDHSGSGYSSGGIDHSHPYWYHHHDNDDYDDDEGSSGGSSGGDSGSGSDDSAPELVDGLPYQNFGGGWNGWGTGKDGWGQWGSEWDWGNWANAIVPFAMPGNPPEGLDGDFFGEVVDASSKQFKLKIEQCKMATKSKCDHPVATYLVEGIYGGLRAKDGRSWSIECEFPTTTITASAKSMYASYDGYAYNTPICTEFGAGEPVYSPKSYIWSGDKDSYPDEFTSEDVTTTKTKAHHRTHTHSSTDAATPTAEETDEPLPPSTPDEATPTSTRSKSHPKASETGHAAVKGDYPDLDESNESDPSENDFEKGSPDTTGYTHDSDDFGNQDTDDDDFEVLKRRPSHPHTTAKPDVYKTSFAPDNFIQLTIISGKHSLSSACSDWKKADVSTIGGPGGWVGYGGWGGNWGQSTREAKPTDTVTVYVPITTKGHVTSTPTMVQARAASSLLSKKSGSTGNYEVVAAKGWAYLFAIMAATTVSLLMSV